MMNGMMRSRPSGPVIIGARLVRDAADDAGEDDEADAVAQAALADELAEPHEQDGAGRPG